MDNPMRSAKSAPAQDACDDSARGFDQALRYPLFSAILNRRTRRISKGIKSVPAGDLSYVSTQPPQPLSEMEEAMLIAALGTTGFTAPDRPFFDEHGKDILASPNIDSMMGRAAGSTDNARATHFFMINDSGTYFLKQDKSAHQDLSFTPQNLIRRANAAKVQVLDRRVDLPRKFPFYLDSNRFLSNQPGTTLFMPVVDLTRQYINGLMYLMTEEEGRRPAILDDRNFYCYAGVKRWVKAGFLNKDIRLPLGTLGTFRCEIEAFLLLQNAMLATQAMGLGGWIHAAMAPPFLLGHPLYAEVRELGLKLDYHTPPRRLLDLLRWATFLPAPRAHPVGFKDMIECMCPPYHKNMSEAVDALIEMKYGKGGAYDDRAYFRRVFKGELGDKYLAKVPKFSKTVVQVVKDICNYIYDKHGRFPAHCDAIHVPGIWLQAHHLDLKYYDQLFNGAYSDAQRDHDAIWHARAMPESAVEAANADSNIDQVFRPKTPGQGARKEDSDVGPTRSPTSEESDEPSVRNQAS